MAVRVADITRMAGAQTTILTGLSLVTGLKGTGDGGDYMPAIRPLASLLKQLNDAASIEELSKAQNVAVVSLTVRVPRNGVRQGEQLDVYVTSVGAAGSLHGGMLFTSPMQGPIPSGGKAPVYALSAGPISIEDPSTPTVGIVKGGCVMEKSLQPQLVDNGHFSLLIEEPSASFTMANVIARTINGAESENGETIAYVVDAKEVVVNIPPAERERPDGFISRVQQLALPMIPAEARVQVNARTGTLIITGDVEISPVVISQKGLTISTVIPAPVPTPRTPITRTRDIVGIDTVSPARNAKLEDLMAALDQLKVPIDDKITILEQLYQSGKLHAKLIVD
ncbi:MAG TPA: flagellar basal body P-ring protein FlgI [Beijerinckiaceae bacterium]|nr:flagellar basal body P-ring protein FlgI [Beijerinckiaceae bacterium]